MGKSLNILYEDNHLIAINKNSSDIVQGDKTNDTPLTDYVKQYIKEKYNKPGEVYLGLPHRLDRPTSGIVLLAKTSKALSRLNEMFRDKDIQKTYWAVVKNKPKNSNETLLHYLKKNNVKNKSVASLTKKQGYKESSLTYSVIAKTDNYYLLEVLPATGRHHQIRVQLSSIGCPIKGDLKYGFPRSNKNAGIHLHARKISFIHPVKKEPITITAPVPNDPLWLAFEKTQ